MGALIGAGERWRVSELLDRFVHSVRYWSPATAQRREAAARMVRADRLGAVRVGRLTPVILTVAVTRWQAEGVGVAGIRARHDVLRCAVSWAVRQRWLATDVLAGARPTRGCVPRGQVPLPAARAVITAARQGGWRCAQAHILAPTATTRQELFAAQQRLLLVLLVTDTGLRRGELAGLRSDDLLGHELWVERAIKSCHGIGPSGVGSVGVGGVDGGRICVGPTKSHRHGRLTVSAATGRYWRDHVLAWHGPAALRGSPAVWLFTATPDTVRPVHPQTLATRFARARDAAGVDHASLHGVRHTVATSLVAIGKIGAAQRRLRHSALDTTMRHYVDPTGLDDQAVADDLARVYLPDHPSG